MTMIAASTRFRNWCSGYHNFMIRPTTFVLAILLYGLVAVAQRTSPPSPAELAQVTERGRQLAEYDVAAWYGSDAVMALQPTQGSVTRYIARKKDGSWTVAFGRLNDKRDKFVIAYEAIQKGGPREFIAAKLETRREDSGFFLSAAKAIETALADFKGASRPYNVAVLPATSDQLFVYVVPGQTENGIYPLGADARYLVSKDGSQIVEKRQLHKAIIEFKAGQELDQVAGSFHTAILDDIPEDTDVFHVLVRQPSVPEWVATRQYVFRIETDGTIRYLMKTEDFRKEQ